MGKALHIAVHLHSNPWIVCFIFFFLKKTAGVDFQLQIWYRFAVARQSR
jgi:hypothetical protein